MKKRILLPVLTGVSLVMLLGFGFREELSVMLLPKVVLSRAITQAEADLVGRFEKDPFGILLRTLGTDYTLDGFVELRGSFPSQVRLDGVLGIDTQKHQLQAVGTASASDKALGLALYMDPEYLAVSSGQLTEGNYYGITYDTFPQDIRGIPLLNVFISDAVFCRWENTVKVLQEQMSRKYPIPSVTNLPEDAVRSLSMGVLALPCTAEQRTLTVNGRTLKCKALIYHLEGEEPLRFPEQTDALTLTFYLNKSCLAALQCQLSNGDGYFLQLGTDPKTEPLMLSCTDSCCGVTGITAETVTGESCSGHRWEITAKGERYEIFYEWEKGSGKMQLSLNGAPDAAELYVRELEDGFSVRTDQLEKLIGADREGNWIPVGCDLTVTKGAEIAPPEYKNLDQWSLEDFLLLAEGIGAWIGLRFN